ncbi:MAG: redox-sensing transcriptional repressor Rex [Elusimicrobia bacterium]|nr:redox-sensing transcriptional repressor Rex [Elusimicrobiota bacterium]
MSDRQERKISGLAVPRLSQYYRALLDSQSRKVISSEELSLLTGFSAAQIRRDLACFGQFGKPGLGYNVEDLKNALIQILGMDREWNVALVGVGNLGAALLGYKGFRRPGFRLVAAFDIDSQKVGQTVEGVPILHEDHLIEFVQKESVQLAVITVPAAAAQEVADLLVRAGIRALLNFAPLRLKVPDSVMVHNIDVAIELERLSFLASRMKNVNFS